MARASGSRGKECGDHLLLEKLTTLNSAILRRKDITLEELEDAYKEAINYQSESLFGLTDGNGIIFMYGVLLMVILFLTTPALVWLFEYILSTRCFLGNNYIIWEATRPISDCSHCKDLTGPIILQNCTREEFAPYAYSSQPIIMKQAVAHWDAVKNLNYSFLKDLYLKIPGAIESVHQDCQFLHFKSNFMTLADVFSMSDDRVNNVAGEEPWYVGWSNCNPLVLQELRKLYPTRPHFLPEDAELPNSDFVFLGYEQGAIMHIDYISRLMWQAQLRGNKTWILNPTPECEDVCKTLSFYVEPGDALLIDTRIWYHETHIPKGEFSMTIQSEYG